MRLRCLARALQRAGGIKCVGSLRASDRDGSQALPLAAAVAAAAASCCFTGAGHAARQLSL